ncbi:MAG: hypothetical protein OEW05_06530 [Candidatus Aminicenantes bacterium]|nr:hypothetical protein [Candidatus Aminicenantes bacterium]
MRKPEHRGKLGLAIFVLGMAVGTAACLVPPFSDLQGAKMAGKGRVELTPHGSLILSSSEGETDHIQNNFGLQAAAGIANFLDLRLRYEYLYHPDSGDMYDNSFSGHVFGFGPKFSLVKDHLAVFLPVGFAFGENIEVEETWEFHPTVLLTFPVSDAFEVNTSAKALIPFREEQNTTYAVNLGFGISQDLRRWALRPEVGILFDTEGDGFYLHFSLGFTYAFGK